MNPIATLIGLLPIFVSAMVAIPTAQTVTVTTGAVNGVVTDTTQAVVPGVTVRLSGPSAMAAQTTETDEAGTFRFSAVPPGDYAISFELAGFTTLTRDGVHVALGFTASVHVELQPGAVTDSLIVTGSPVIDASSTAVAVHFDHERLATMPGARDIFAVLANTPGVAMARMDVGGNGALAIQEYTAYGLRATTGMHRNEVEGIRVGGANGANDNYFSDFASFAEIAVEAVGHSAAMPVPGTMAQYVSKSGGNSYRGSAYADFQRDGWQTTNIDADQIARGVIGGPDLDPRDVNRLQQFRDFTADVGGFLKKSRAWWYAAYRTTEVRQRYAWLLDAATVLGAHVASGKVMYHLSPRQRLVGYLQRQAFEQSSFFLAGTTQAIQTSGALPRLEAPVSVWKAEYNTALSDAVYAEVRAGGYHSGADQTYKGTAPRIVDIGANTAAGASFAGKRLISRPQLNGSLSLVKGGLAGSHAVRIGGEYMIDRVDAPHLGYGNSCNCVSTLNTSKVARR
jgi:hypothetical protein